MQDRHGRDLADSVMLGPAFQTSWVMKNLHDKFTLFQTQTCLHLIKITDFDFSHFGGGAGGTTSSTVPASGTATTGEQERHGADTNASSKGTSNSRKNKKETKKGTNLHDGSGASASTSINSAGIFTAKKDNSTNPTADASGTSAGSSWTSAMFAENQNPPQVAPAVEVDVGEAVAPLGAAPVNTPAQRKQSSKSSKHAKQNMHCKSIVE